MPSMRVDGAQQIREARAPLTRPQVPPVRVDVLAEQRHLADAVPGQLGDLPHDVAHPSAHLRPAHRGHDAERAGVVTADLDRDPGRVVDFAAGRERRRIRLVLLEDLHHRAPPAGRLRKQLGRPGQVVRAEHDVDVPGTPDDVVAVLLGQTAAHRDLQPGPAVLEGLEVAEMAVELVVRVLPDAARVEDDDVGRLEVVGRLQPVGGEQPRDALRVVLVHLATERADVEAAGHDGRFYADS